MTLPTEPSRAGSGQSATEAESQAAGFSRAVTDVVLPLWRVGDGRALPGVRKDV
jgi:hypothetical protein